MADEAPRISVRPPRRPSRRQMRRAARPCHRRTLSPPGGPRADARHGCPRRRRCGCRDNALPQLPTTLDLVTGSGRVRAADDGAARSPGPARWRAGRTVRVGVPASAARVDRGVRRRAGRRARHRHRLVQCDAAATHGWHNGRASSEPSSGVRPEGVDRRARTKRPPTTEPHDDPLTIISMCNLDAWPGLGWVRVV